MKIEQLTKYVLSVALAITTTNHLNLTVERTQNKTRI